MTGNLGWVTPEGLAFKLGSHIFYHVLKLSLKVLLCVLLCYYNC